MDKKKFGLNLIFFVTASFLLLFMNCKNQSTTPDTTDSGADNSISATCNPASGSTGTEVMVAVSINKSQAEIKAFGLTMIFDPDVFQYMSTRKTFLTQSWSIVDGNESNPGKLIAGGFAGTGFSIPEGSSGNLFQVKFKIIYSGGKDNFTSQITIKNYLDDISEMTPRPTSATFTYKK